MPALRSRELVARRKSIGVWMPAFASRRALASAMPDRSVRLSRSNTEMRFVWSAAKAIALVEVRGLLGHPDRRRDADRGGDAFTDLRADRSLHRQAYALRSELLQVRSAGQVHGCLVD